MGDAVIITNFTFNIVTIKPEMLGNLIAQGPVCILPAQKGKVDESEMCEDFLLRIWIN